MYWDIDRVFLSIIIGMASAGNKDQGAMAPPTKSMVSGAGKRKVMTDREREEVLMKRMNEAPHVVHMDDPTSQVCIIYIIFAYYLMITF